MTTKIQATIEDLYHVPENGKAEIIDGELVLMSPTGFLPSRASGEIYSSLRNHERKTKSGFAVPDNAGFIVNLPNRRSFSPDAAWFVGKPTGMKFVEGAPLFAVEVRSEEDDGPRAERKNWPKSAGTTRAWNLMRVGC